MMNVVKRYYHAWETQDGKTLKKVLHPSIFGIRTYTEDLYFSVEEVLKDFEFTTIQKIVIEDMVELGNSVQYSLHITDGKGSYDVLAKAVVLDSKIYKVYEEIKKDSKRIQCVCMYDGSLYNGFQKQVHEQTIQQTLEDTIKEALRLDCPPSIHASGRTDKGVHAIEQVFHMDIFTQIPIDKMKDILNNYLPDSIYITSCVEVNQTVHSRYDIITKEYMYKINTGSYNPIQRNYEWFVEGLDLVKLEQTLQQIKGTHDFQSFTKYSTKSTIRTIKNVECKIENNHVYIHITGTGFLRYMVRYIIMAAVQITQGKLPYTMTELLALKDQTILKEMAPACGLYLFHVAYE